MLLKAKKFSLIFFALCKVPGYILKFNKNSIQKIFLEIETENIKTQKTSLPINKIIELVRMLVLCFQFSKNCFLRAYVSYKVLADLGIKSHLYVGVNADKSFKSHAWIQIGKKLVLESPQKINNLAIIYTNNK
tara:strand:+ start:215 stop:613 length:399 start_codon:yes stop_codon:yes gene_type:complete